ncbi:MAG: MerR family transcriptional regulator [Chloroflexi bacterium]|nr:MerR family transcriptional regulator [Chloroflexota bacterium]
MTKPESRETVTEWRATLLGSLLAHPSRQSKVASHRNSSAEAPVTPESSDDSSVGAGGGVSGRVTGLYIISVAARLTEMHPQTLRKYERVGLLFPSRTEGSLRLYSENDLARLRLIRILTEKFGLNLAGVGLVMELVFHLHHVLDNLESTTEIFSTSEGNAAVQELKGILVSLEIE